MYTYKGYGLYIESDLYLPQLEEVSHNRAPDVVIRRDEAGEIPGELIGENRFVSGLRGDDIFLLWRKFGHFLIRGGREIVYSPPAEDESSAGAALLGVVFGTLLHQRHVFTLHAGAIDYNGRAVAFVAHKGTGKSTTCVNMYGRGYPLITDDVLAIRLEEEGGLQVDPAFPTMKLNPDAVESIGKDPSQYDIVSRAFDKRYFTASDQFTSSSLPLGTIYVLENGDDFEVHELDQKDAFMQMLEHSYVVRFFGRLAAGKEHFLDCERIVKSVRVKRLVRPRDLSRMEDYLDFIEADLEADRIAPSVVHAQY